MYTLHTLEDSALILSEGWKLRLSLVKKDFIRLNNAMKNKVEKMVEEENGEIDGEQVEKKMIDIFLVEDFIEEINTMIKKIGKYPLSVENVERISYFEKEYYTRIMTPQILEILSEEVRQEEQFNNMLTEIVEQVNTMWDNNDSEENIKKYLFQTVKNIYTNYSIAHLSRLVNLLYTSLTAEKPVRVSLSDEQIATLPRKKGLTGTCGTCLENYNEDEEMIVLTCGHNFHPDCITPWLKRSVKCPNCRHDLRE
jgi:hypothetical protein